MSDLVLPLKRKWFDAIKNGEKTEEYRLDTPYWRKRLWGRTYDRIVLTLGYPRRDDRARRIVRPWRGYTLYFNFRHEEWGNEPRDVFAIDLTQGEGT